jgi:hypothetical protein
VSHGKKKWIIAYDGKLKRSNDRTKKDYWKNLRDWRPMDGRRSWGRKGDFCPQCKHISKEIVAQDDAYHEAWRAIRSEFDTLYAEAERAWQRYRIGCFVPRPRVPEPPAFYKWMEKQRKTIPPKWVYDDRSYLCFKCERKYEMQNRMWYEDLPGKKADRNWSVKWNRKKYRNEVRNLMQRAKYDEEYYDDIGPYTHDWLD